MQEDEKKYRQKSLLITIGVQVIVMVILYIAIAWREIIPPLPEYGIELSIGLEQSNVDQSDTNQPAAQTNEEVNDPTTTQDEVLENLEENNEPQKAIENSLDESESESEPQETTTEDINSPDIKEVEKTDTNPIKEIIEPAIVESEQEDLEAQSDSLNEPATENDEELIDERALYSNTSGTGENSGATLQLTGWRLDDIPDPKDSSQESGKIVYEIKVDAEGYIVSIKTLTSTITPSVELLYRRSVEQLILEKTDDYKPAPFSVGKITFILKSR